MACDNCSNGSADAAAVEMLKVAGSGPYRKPCSTAMLRSSRNADSGKLACAAVSACKAPAGSIRSARAPQYGICGADRDTIVARHLVRAIAAGTAAHSEHGRHIALAMLHIADGTLPDYTIKDKEKLFAITERLGIKTEGP